MHLGPLSEARLPKMLSDYTWRRKFVDYCHVPNLEDVSFGQDLDSISHWLICLNSFKHHTTVSIAIANVIIFNKECGLATLPNRILFRAQVFVECLFRGKNNHRTSTMNLIRL